MSETMKERLDEALSEMPSEDVHTLVAFAEFLAQRRCGPDGGAEQLSEEQHARILTALDGVAALSIEEGPSVSNRDHDQCLYGGK
jgi:hypothetical protein